MQEIPILGPCGHELTDGAAELDAAVEAVAPSLSAREPNTLVVNDPQRDTQTAAVLERLRAALPASAFRILVATGTHRFDAARRQAFEEEALSAGGAEQIAWHDCTAGDLASVPGRTPWRCHPWLLAGPGPVLAIGSCQGHYFAGITGAHKTVTVGCAARDDVETNHANALSKDSRAGRLAGNPVHESIAAMVASLEARRPLLAINLLQLNGRILSAAAGTPLEALERVAPAVRSTYFRGIPSPADALVLAAEGVLGSSFYQADKAIKNNEWAVRDGGCLVLLAPCPEGIGQDHFMSLLRECGDYASAVAEVAHRGYRLGDHKAVKLRYLTDVRGVRVFIVSDGIAPAEAEVMGMTKAGDVEAALASAGIDPAREKVFRVADAANTCVTVDPAAKAL